MIDLNEETTLGDLLDEVRRISLTEARRRGLKHAAAEDIAQTAAIKFWMAFREGKQIRSVEAWVRTSTRNLIANRYRDESRQKRGGGIVESLTGVLEERFARA